MTPLSFSHLESQFIPLNTNQLPVFVKGPGTVAPNQRENLPVEVFTNYSLEISSAMENLDNGLRPDLEIV
jgi:hypothetical protein